MRRSAGYLAVAALILISAVACSSDSPESAARSWLDAIVKSDGNTIGALTCTEQQSQTQLGMGALAVAEIIGQGLIGQAAQLDTSGLQYATTAQSGDTATVRISGNVRVAILTLWQTQSVSADLAMRFEDGRWKYCGGS